MAVITISRQFGAGGKTLGEMLSERLGYTLYDNELIQMISEKAKVSESGVEFIEKEARGKFRNFISGMVPKAISDIKLKKTPDDAIGEVLYIDMLNEVITKIAEEGNAVIIGRGGQYILKDKKDVVHVLATARKEDRVNFLVNKYQLTPKEAQKAVELDDKRRLNLYRKYRKDDYDKPINYHLVLNTSKISLDSACELVCELVKS
jgi:cytidylate kinase